MKKLDNKGFILAETLVVSVFLMVIFGMIYSNFYPIIGEYEKREFYDDVDGKYAAYWIKRMLESDDANLNFVPKDYMLLNQLGYLRFDCGFLQMEKRDMCAALVKELEISRCDSGGANCDIFITRYTLDYDDHKNSYDFKDTVRKSPGLTYLAEKKTYLGDEWGKAWVKSEFEGCCDYEYESRGYGDESEIDCSVNTDITNFSYNSPASPQKDEVFEFCRDKAQNVFPSPVKDYILSLPDYKNVNNRSNSEQYRIIVVMYHKKQLRLFDGSEKAEGYYSFATMEVSLHV